MMYVVVSFAALVLQLWSLVVSVVSVSLMKDGSTLSTSPSVTEAKEKGRIKGGGGRGGRGGDGS